MKNEEFLTLFARARIEKVKKSLADKLSEIDTNNIDKKSFAQELIYYLENKILLKSRLLTKNIISQYCKII